MKTQSLREETIPYDALPSDLTTPVLLKRDGEPIAVLISVEEYDRYRSLVASQRYLSAHEAQRVADHTIFDDLVGCALNSGEPLWVSLPEPRWRIPYRTFDGELMKLVDVDAQTGMVLVTSEERSALLDKVEALANSRDDKS